MKSVRVMPVILFTVWIAYSQNHYNGVDFLIEDLPYPDFTYAGVPGGIPRNPPGDTYNAGDYTGTDRERVQAAVDEASSAGGGIVYLPAGTYQFDDHVKLTHDNIVIRGAGADQTKIILQNASANEHETGAFSFFGGEVPKTSVGFAADVKKGDRVLELRDTPPFSAGDLVMIRVHSDDIVKTNDFYRKKFHAYADGADWDYGHTGYYLIESVKGSFIILSQPIRVTFSKTPAGKPFSLASYMRGPIDMIENCGVEDLSIETEKFADKMYTSGISFTRTFSCWVADIHVAWAGSHPIHFSLAKNIEARDLDIEHSWNLGGGGNGYLPLWSTSDGLMENIVSDSLRHAPNFQGHANGCVFRNSVFTRNNMEWHGGHTVENMFENVSILKDAPRETMGLNALASTRLDDPYDGHEPHFHGQVVYNCDIRIDRPRCNSARLGGLHEDWILAYNRIVNYDRNAAIFIGDYARGLVFKGNNVGIQNYSGHELEYMTAFPDSGWDTTSLTYNANIEPHFESIKFIDTKVYGFPSDRLWNGLNSNVEAALIDSNTQVFSSVTDVPRPVPPIPSILQYQRDMKQNQPSVEITSPEIATIQSESFTMKVAADPTNAVYGSLTKVRFYNGDIFLGEDKTPPFEKTVDVSGVNGFMRLKAEAFYDSERFYDIVMIKAAGGTTGQMYTLTVTGGLGDNKYEEGATVEIVADDPSAGKRFDKWEGDVEYVDDIHSAATTVTMPGKDIAVTAGFVDQVSTRILVGTQQHLVAGSNPRITVFDLNGRVIHRTTGTKTTQTIQLERFPAGIYILQAKTRTDRKTVRFAVW